MQDHNTALIEFATELKEEFADVYDWIDAAVSDARDGVEHVDEEHLISNPFHVEVGINIAGLDLGDLGDLDERLNEFADEHGVAVDLVGSDPDGTCTYRFSMHAKFLGNAEAVAASP